MGYQGIEEVEGLRRGMRMEGEIQDIVNEEATTLTKGFLLGISN